MNNDLQMMETEKAFLRAPGKVVVQVHCHIENNLDIFRYFENKLEKVGTIPAASWFKNKDRVLFRFSTCLSWFSGGDLISMIWGNLLGKRE